MMSLLLDTARDLPQNRLLKYYSSVTVHDPNISALLRGAGYYQNLRVLSMNGSMNVSVPLELLPVQVLHMDTTISMTACLTPRVIANRK